MSKSAYGSARSGDTDFRKTWDREEYLKRAAERDERERGGAKKTKVSAAEQTAATPRGDKDLNVSAMLNKTALVSATSTSGGALSGFYCSVCNATLKDSNNYLDHLNGRRHLERAGKAAKPERVGVDRVRDRLDALKRQSEKPAYDLDAAVKQRQEQEAREKEARKMLKRAAKEAEKEESDDVAAIMGFGGFGGSRKNN